MFDWINGPPDPDTRVYQMGIDLDLVPANGNPVGPLHLNGVQYGLIGCTRVTFEGNSEEGVEVVDVTIDDIALLPLYPGPDDPAEVPLSSLVPEVQRVVLDHIFDEMNEWAFRSIPSGEMELFGELVG